jgi:hypothetical protein
LAHSGHSGKATGRTVGRAVSACAGSLAGSSKYWNSISDLFVVNQPIKFPELEG